MTFLQPSPHCFSPSHGFLDPPCALDIHSVERYILSRVSCHHVTAKSHVREQRSSRVIHCMADRLDTRHSPPYFIDSLCIAFILSHSLRFLLHRYVRIRRKNQSFFILCTPTNTALHLKQQVALALKEQHEPTVDDSRTLQLQTLDGRVLEDELILEQVPIQNEQELCVCFPISDGEWEQVDVVSPETGMTE